MRASARSGNVVSIGIMGGTFDPIHIGHLILAEEARQQLELDEVLFVPAGEPPHKRGQVIAAAEHRLQMVRLAVADNEYFECSTVELDRDGPSYTIDTVKEILDLLGESTRLFVLIGADEARDLMSWRDPYGIQALATIVVADRPGFEFDELVSVLPSDFACKLVRLRMPGVDISSTDIRDRIRSGRSIKYLVPEVVDRYISEKGIYGAMPRGTQV